MSFDLHINPYQMIGAAQLLQRVCIPFSPHSSIPTSQWSSTILDARSWEYRVHLRSRTFSVTLCSDSPRRCVAHGQEVIAEWRAGMSALAAAGPHVHVKLSMLCYPDDAWDGPSSLVPGLVHEIITLFGADRYETCSCGHLSSGV